MAGRRSVARRRHARQDLDHLDAHRRGAGLRRRPVLRDRRRPQRVRQQRARRHRRRLRRRGRRERRLVPAARPVRARSSPTSRPTTSTTTATCRGRGRLRPVRRARVDPRRVRRRLRRRPRRGPAAPRAGRRRRLRTYGTAEDADLRLADLDVAADGTSYTAVLDGAGARPGARSAVPGEHMALNSAAALLAGLELGLPAAGADRRAGPLRRGAPPVRAQGRRRRASASTTTTPTTRPRSRAQLRGRPRGGRAAAGWWSPSSRTCTAAPASSPRASARRSGWPTRSWCMDVYGAREDPVPGVTGALVADAVPLPAERVRLRAVLVGRGARAGRPRPARATWWSPWAPATSRWSGRRCSRPCAASGRRATSEPHRRRADPATATAGPPPAPAPAPPPARPPRGAAAAGGRRHPPCWCAAAGRRCCWPPRRGCCGRARCSRSATVQVDGVAHAARRPRCATAAGHRATGTPLLRVDVDAAAARVRAAAAGRLGRRSPAAGPTASWSPWPSGSPVAVVERAGQRHAGRRRRGAVRHDHRRPAGRRRAARRRRTRAPATRRPGPRWPRSPRCPRAVRAAGRPWSPPPRRRRTSRSPCRRPGDRALGRRRATPAQGAALRGLLEQLRVRRAATRRRRSTSAPPHAVVLR